MSRRNIKPPLPWRDSKCLSGLYAEVEEGFVRDSRMKVIVSERPRARPLLPLGAGGRGRATSTVAARSEPGASFSRSRVWTSSGHSWRSVCSAGSQILKTRPAALSPPKVEMAGIADPLLRGHSLGLSQIEQFFSHQPRRPPLVWRDGPVQVCVLGSEARFALTAFTPRLLHDFILRYRCGRPQGGCVFGAGRRSHRTFEAEPSCGQWAAPETVKKRRFPCTCSF
jgi:hypothetical protein